MNSVDKYSNFSNTRLSDICYSIDSGNEQTNEQQQQLSSLVNEKKRIHESASNRCAKKNRRNNSNESPSYIQVFRCEKPAHVVARRNARERRRVQAVNSAFSRLQKAVPTENQSKRLSKVKTLQKAIEYISNLMNLLGKASELDTNCTPVDSPSTDSTSSTSSMEETSFTTFPEHCFNKENSTCHQLEETATDELNSFIDQWKNEEAVNMDYSRDYYWNYFMNAMN